MNDNEPARDEHLRAALRHAPDAALDAPADVGAQIRAAAFRAATAAGVATPPSVAAAWPQRLWSWLGQPGRMGASGALATVLVAGVIGLVWRGEAPAPQVEQKTPVEITTPRAAAPAPRAAAPAAAPEVLAKKSTPRAETAPAPAPAPVAERRKADSAERITDAPPAAPPAAAPLPAEPMAVRHRADSSDSRASPPAVASPAAVPRGLNPAERATSAFAKSSGAASAADFATWLDEAAARGDATPLLAELLALTRGRWLAAAAPSQQGQEKARAELPSAGGPAATLTVGDDVVWGCLAAPVPRCQRAPLAPEQAARLRELLGVPRR